MGDTKNDIIASKKAKTNFILAKYGYNNKHLKSKFFIRKFSDILNICKMKSKLNRKQINFFKKSGYLIIKSFSIKKNKFSK